MNNQDKEKCREIRTKLSELWDQPEDTRDSNSVFSVESHMVETHMEDCTDCRTWRVQMTLLANSARSIPELDVPEELTQRILQSVEELSPRPRFSWAFASVLVLAAAITLFMLYAYDRGYSLTAWSISLAIAFSIHVLTSPPKFQPARQVD